MIQASTEIAKRLVEMAANLKGKIGGQGNRLEKRKKPLLNNKLSSFINKLALLFDEFGGMASFVTTLLTPNPFDEIAKYLKKEFDEIDMKLSGIKSDFIS